MAPKTKLDIAWTVEQYRSGRSATDIAAEKSVCVSTVCRTLALGGVERRNDGAKKRPLRTTCRHCGTDLGREVDPQLVSTHGTLCPECKRKYLRDYHLRTRYGLTAEQYDAILESQGGGCAICGRGDIQFTVDHDHACCPGKRSCGKCVRGILCTRCNQAIGYLGEHHLGAALGYLRRWAAVDPSA